MRDPLVYFKDAMSWGIARDKHTIHVTFGFFFILVMYQFMSAGHPEEKATARLCYMLSFRLNLLSSGKRLFRVRMTSTAGSEPGLA